LVFACFLNRGNAYRASQDQLSTEHNPPQKHFRSASLHFPTRLTVLVSTFSSLVCGEKALSQFSFMFLLVTSLMLTVCVGVAAWRISDDRAEVTGSISPSNRMR
jgi:hypothetical protein